MPSRRLLAPASPGETRESLGPNPGAITYPITTRRPGTLRRAVTTALALAVTVSTAAVASTPTRPDPTAGAAEAAATASVAPLVSVTDPSAAGAGEVDDRAEAKSATRASRAVRRATADAQEAAQIAADVAARAAAVTAVPANRDASRAKTPTAPKKATTAKAPTKAPAKAPARASRSTARAPRTANTTAAVPAVPASGRVEIAVAFALAQLGEPYVHGAAGPGAWDCSGLVMAAFAKVGLGLPHKADEIATRGTSIPRGQWRRGDILHWPGHVAIYLGNNQLVHASRAGVPVKIASVWGSPTARRLL